MAFRAEIPRIEVNVSEIQVRQAVKAVQEEMADQAAICRKRAQSNQRANGGAIKSNYSKGYVEAILAGEVKSKTGVRKTSTIPNLTVGGDFLNSIQMATLSRGARIYFNGNHPSGESNASLARSLFRRGFSGWFEVSKADRTRISKRIFDIFKGQVKRAVKFSK